MQVTWKGSMICKNKKCEIWRAKNKYKEKVEGDLEEI